MSKLTKQLRREWADFQRVSWGWKSFLILASSIYSISRKEVRNRVQP